MNYSFSGLSVGALLVAIGLIGYLVVAWRVLIASRARGANPWPAGYFLVAIAVQGWLALQFATFGHIVLHGAVLGVTDLYLAGVICASLGGIAGVAMGMRVSLPALTTRFGVQPKKLLGAAIVLAVATFLVHVYLNRSVVVSSWSHAMEFSEYLVEMRRGITKYEEWRGQGIIRSVLDIQALILGAVAGVRLTGGDGRPSSLLKALGLLLIAMICAAADGTRSKLVGVIVIMLFATWTRFVIKQVYLRQLVAIALVGALIVALTIFTKIMNDDRYRDANIAKVLVSQSVQRVILGNAVHDIQLAGYIERHEIRGAYQFAELQAQIMAPLPGPPPERLSARLREIGTFAGTSTSFWSATEIGRRLYDFGPIAVFIGYFLQGVVVAAASKKAGLAIRGSTSFYVWMVIGFLGATSSGVINMIPDVALLFVTVTLAWFASQIGGPRRRRRLAFRVPATSRANPWG